MTKHRFAAQRTVVTPNGSRVTIEGSAIAGGAYVDLTFNGGPPVEVINVWDYDAGRSEFAGGDRALGLIIAEWIRQQDEWPEFAEVYAAQ